MQKTDCIKDMSLKFFQEFYPNISQEQDGVLEFKDKEYLVGEVGDNELVLKLDEDKEKDREEHYIYAIINDFEFKKVREDVHECDLTFLWQQYMVSKLGQEYFEKLKRYLVLDVEREINELNQENTRIRTGDDFSYFPMVTVYLIKTKINNLRELLYKFLNMKYEDFVGLKQHDLVDLLEDLNNEEYLK